MDIYHCGNGWGVQAQAMAMAMAMSMVLSGSEGLILSCKDV